MLIVQMRITKQIHRVLQAIIIMKILQAPGDREDDFGAFAHVQGVDCSGVLDDVVAWSRDPVVSVVHTMSK